MECIAVIPARYGSTRLPGKPLRDLCGRPVIERVYERVRKAGIFSRIIVATDSEEIRNCVQGFGGDAVLTAPHHRSGTDRIAEVARTLDAPVIVNIQGDEPFVHPEMLRELWVSFSEEKVALMGTLRYPILDPEDLSNPNVVKVVTDEQGYALYFSRSAIPHRRADGLSHGIDGPTGVWYKHVGIYAYQREFLLQYPLLRVTALEKTESLEQLRALGHGYRMRVYTTQWETFGIDTEEDLQKARDRWTERE